MGELFGGRSATCPTLARSTSVRTRMDLQYSQTVCTLADQRKVIFAPQLGQFAVGCVIGFEAPLRQQQVLIAPHTHAPLSEPERWWRQTDVTVVPQSPTACGAHSKKGSGTANRTRGRCGRRGGTQRAGRGRLCRPSPRTGASGFPPLSGAPSRRRYGRRGHGEGRGPAATPHYTPAHPQSTQPHS